MAASTTTAATMTSAYDTLPSMAKAGMNMHDLENEERAERLDVSLTSNSILITDTTMAASTSTATALLDESGEGYPDKFWLVAGTASFSSVIYAIWLRRKVSYTLKVEDE